MAGFEDVQPLENMRMPLQSRNELRQTFGRWLSQPNQGLRSREPDDAIDELSILELCQHYRLEYPGGAEDLGTSWDESEQRIADGGPTFEQLQNMEWISFDGGRWVMPSVPFGIGSPIIYPSPSTEVFLRGLSKAQLVAKTNEPPLHVRMLVDKILAKFWLERRMPVKNPDWLTSRLWQQLCPKPQSPSAEYSSDTEAALFPQGSEARDDSSLLDPDFDAVDRAFLEWSAWCNAIGNYGSWGTRWDFTEMRYCREAAYRALKRQSLWGAWKNDAAQYTAVLESTFAIPLENLRYGGVRDLSPPETLVAGVDWVRRPDVEHLIMGRFGSSTASFAFNLLCSELEETGVGPDILPASTAVLSFAADHPMAFQHLLHRASSAPALLADMLLYSRTACLAVKLAIEWRPEFVRQNDRNLAREAQARVFVIQDALSVLAYYLMEGTTDLAEYGALVTWCYASGPDSRRAFADSRRPIGRTLLELVAKADPECQSGVLKHLVDQATYKNNIPRACFAGVLDALSCLSKAPVTIAFPTVAAYSQFAYDLHLDWTDAPSLPAILAAQLVSTAFACAKSDRDALLIPLDSAELLRNASNDQKHSVRSSIARTLREHVRLLARAVAGWPGDAIPSELCETLITLTSRSVIEHDEKGRIGALTDRYRSGFLAQREETPPAEDLAAAWKRLDDSLQEAMLQAFVLSDDPVLLAELCQYLPMAAKPKIRARLRQLKPAEASTFWTWTEAIHRIDSLIAAGEYVLAREHLNDIDQDLERAPPQYRIELFDLELRLLIKETNWAALDEAIVPPTLNQHSKQQAQDKLDFYRATSHLLRPDGNLVNARASLQRLAARPDAAIAYKENAFAVAIQQLLGPTLQPLTGDSFAAGESLLSDINVVIASVGDSATNSLLANRALLLLALRKPEDAIASIATRRREKRDSDLELITVLAMSESGRKDEAMAILDAAIVEFDSDDRLTTLKNDLQTNGPTPSYPATSVVQDPTSWIRPALQALSELNPSQVGDILGPPGTGFRGYLVRQVSRALASLQHMAAMLRDRKNSESEARYENDLNTAFREVLSARLAVVKWDVADQSLGGATSNGNPGERDAVIRISGHEMSIFEALVCSGIDRNYIRGHFHKLLSYGVCELYFHVIYSFAKDLTSIHEYVGEMLEHEVPSGLTYLKVEPVGPPDYETTGYVATYSVDHREITVVFLIVDLRNSRASTVQVVE